MKFDVPDHAKFRIMERGINVDDAKRVIDRPDSQKNQPDGKIVVTAKLDSGRVLTVIYIRKTKNKAVIITGYYES